VFLAKILLALRDYESFTRLAHELGKVSPKQADIRPLIRIAETIDAPEFPDFAAPKLFGIGLSRTATTSLHAALQALGIRSIHWVNPQSRNVITADDFLLFDAFSDIPVSYQFEQLYHTFPNARFIYTTRSVESWEKSVKRHYQKILGVSLPHELRAPAHAQRFDFSAGPMEMNLYGRYRTWREAFEAYEQRVRSFFQDKPPEKLLELGICAGEGWEKLCAFLERPIPTQPFPKTNSGPPKNPVAQ
jgi:hypothetical protein